MSKQTKYMNKFTRPLILIDKNEYSDIKLFIQNKGYNSMSDYINMIIKLDKKFDIIPQKNHAISMLSQED